LQVVAAAEAVAQGKSMDSIVAQLNDMSARTHAYAVLDTLEFLRRSGRLSRFQSSLGSVLQVKPIIKMHHGEMDLERIRTRRAALLKVIEMVENLGPLDQLALVHTHAPERAEALHKQAEHLFPSADAPMSEEVTPVIGAHVGPGAVGFVAIQKSGEHA
jgi:DegV family protein with EDD domain